MGLQAEEAGAIAGDIMSGAIDKSGIEALLDPAKEIINEVVTGVEDIEQQTRQNLRSTQAPVVQNIPLPNVPSIETQTINTVPVEKENKTITTSEKYNNKHPGALNSPMVGTAYSASEPGKDPFIKINSSVTKGDTLLIIEAMKVMNTITAHKSGKVAFIGFEDGQPIEFDQLLIVIE